MDKIAIFIAHYSIANSSPIVNLLDFLSDKYEIDVYLNNVSLVDCPVMSKSNIRVININRLNVYTLRFFPVYGSYRFHIAIDPHGFVLCKSIFPHSRPLYYSLELYMSYDSSGLYYPKAVKKRERYAIKDIAGLIIQSTEKDKLFRADYQLPSSVPTLILPVTYQGPSSSDKSDYLRNKLGIAATQRIALHLGGIAEWFSCIELAEAFSLFPSWSLVFHGYPTIDYLEKFKAALRHYSISNVYIHDEQFDDQEQVYKIVRSCDLGVAWYNDISIGFRTAGHSSGKIPAYMRFGLPVVAKKYRSTVEAIELCGAGVCIDSFDEISGAVTQIEANYEEYSQQARAAYDSTYNFEVYKVKLIEFITATGATV